MSIMSPSSLIPREPRLAHLFVVSTAFELEIKHGRTESQVFPLRFPELAHLGRVPPVIEQAQVRFRPESRGMYIPMSSESFVHKVTVHATPCPRMTL